MLSIALLLSLFFLPHWLKSRLVTTQRSYLKALNAFEKAGTQGATWQGPIAFSQQISENYPHKVSDPLSQLTQYYLRLTYQIKQDPKITVLTTKKCHRLMKRHLTLLKTELSKHQA